MNLKSNFYTRTEIKGRASEADEDEKEKQEEREGNKDDDNEDDSKNQDRDETDEEDDDEKTKNDDDDSSEEEKERAEARKSKSSSRTVELVWTTGAGVVRVDENGNSYVERLSLDPSAVNLERLNSGSAPLLNSHSRDGISDVIGVIEKAWIDSEKNEGRAIVRFSGRPDVAGILEDVRDGILKNTSVGYKVHRFEDQLEKGVLTKTAVEWEPVEISLVGIPADARSQIRNKLNEGVQVRMNIHPNIKQERERILEIQSATRAAGLSDDFSQRLITSETSLDQARKLIIEEMKKGKTPETRNHIDIRAGDQDESDSRKKGLENAILNRLNSKHKLDDFGRKYHGISLLEAGQECIKRSYPMTGYGISPIRVAERAMNATSDFPMILNNVLNKSMRESFESAPATYQAFTRTVTTRDFKPIYRIQLGEAPLLEPLNEQGEFRKGTLSETQESYKPSTFGKAISLTRETLVSDDLSALQRTSTLLARASADHISESVYNQLCNNPIMSDGRLFDQKKHFNVGPQSEIDLKSLNIGRTAMRLQKGQEGRVLNLIPKTLLVPASLETRAQQYLGQSMLYSLMSSKNAAVETQINPFAGALNIVAEPRLDAYSTNTWYLMTDLAQSDIFELAYLEGQEGPFLDSEMQFGTGGITYVCRLEYGVGAIEWRSWYRFGAGNDLKGN
jgi:phage major head subunit gpT-like protein